MRITPPSSGKKSVLRTFKVKSVADMDACNDDLSEVKLGLLSTPAFNQSATCCGPNV